MKLSPSKRRALWLISKSTAVVPITPSYWGGYAIAGTGHAVNRATIISLERLGYLRIQTSGYYLYPYRDETEYAPVDGMYLFALFRGLVSLEDEHLVDWVTHEGFPPDDRVKRGRKYRKQLRLADKRGVLDPFNWRVDRHGGDDGEL